jgi:hypothetical protein
MLTSSTLGNIMQDGVNIGSLTIFLFSMCRMQMVELWIGNCDIWYVTNYLVSFELKQYK